MSPQRIGFSSERENIVKRWTRRKGQEVVSNRITRKGKKLSRRHDLVNLHPPIILSLSFFLFHLRKKKPRKAWHCSFNGHWKRETTKFDVELNATRQEVDLLSILFQDCRGESWWIRKRRLRTEKEMWKERERKKNLLRLEREREREILGRTELGFWGAKTCQQRENGMITPSKERMS